MMYDTALRSGKVYQWLMSRWSLEVVSWTGHSEVLLGLPAYEDAGVGYHHPDVEDLENALLGIHAGLSRLENLPRHYKGVAIYSEWEMTPEKWGVLQGLFLKP